MMTREKMEAVAFIADKQVCGRIRGVIVNFHGLGDPGLRSVPSYEENEWAAAGGLVVMPYCGPWSWMNRQARALVDELVDAVYAHFNLQDTVPLVLTGGSMGGYCSLLYARYARRPLKACLAQFPVSDLKYHFSERPDLPRTIYCAFSGYAEDLEALFKEHSPLDQVAFMPRVPYLIIHGDADKAVSKAAHSDKLVAAMRKLGFEVEYIEVPGMGHTEPLFYDVYRKKIDFVKRALA
ncbi:MAG: prolyl oligopeptidase family serine peptidase [Planctomycetota bacterium]